MLTIREMPENELRKVDVPFEVLNILDKFFHFKDRKKKVQTIRMVPKPIIIVDDGTLNFNQTYEELEAVYIDKDTEKATYYTLYNLEPYGILGEDKICECERFELDAHRVSV